MNVIYYCTGCNNKTTDSSSLVKGKGGCRSCGKTGYKCPRCGMAIKSMRAPVVPENQPVKQSQIETGVKLKSSSHGAVEKPTRNIRIKRVK